MNENIIEIFSTVQGEGKYVGCRQVFLRLEGCNLHCSYCDTDSAVGMHPDCVVEEGAGTYHLVPYPNPISPQRAAELVEIAAAGVPHQARAAAACSVHPRTGAACAAADLSGDERNAP